MTTMTYAEIVVLAISFVSIVTSIVGVRQSNRRYRKRQLQLKQFEKRVFFKEETTCIRKDSSNEDIISSIDELIKKINSIADSNLSEFDTSKFAQDYYSVVRDVLNAYGPNDAREMLSILRGALSALRDVRRIALRDDGETRSLSELDLLTKRIIEELDGTSSLGATFANNAIDILVGNGFDSNLVLRAGMYGFSVNNKLSLGVEDYERRGR